MSNYYNNKLDKIYKKLPKLNCKGLCTESCSLIKVGELERNRITRLTGNDPFIKDRDILQFVKNNPPSKWTCSLLKAGKCTIYHVRPLICRLFGLVEKMRCPFGCVPDRWLTDKEAKKMLDKAEYFNNKQKVDDAVRMVAEDGAHTIGHAMDKVMEQALPDYNQIKAFEKLAQDTPPFFDEELK